MTASLTDREKQFITSMPKVELHLHIEGAIPLEMCVISNVKTQVCKSIEDHHNNYSRVYCVS